MCAVCGLMWSGVALGVIHGAVVALFDTIFQTGMQVRSLPRYNFIWRCIIFKNLKSCRYIKVDEQRREVWNMELPRMMVTGRARRCSSVRLVVIFSILSAPSSPTCYFTPKNL